MARVLSNVEVGLDRDRASADAKARAQTALAEVGLDDKRAAWPAVLSGGQKQRVAWPARWSVIRACWPSTSRSARSMR